MIPTISIITPTFNHASFVESCIHSVLAQTFPAWEMIIVNDGSTDDTLAVAHRAASGDPRIRIIDQENVGVFRLATTYNRALEQARGEYIAVLEGDDLWDPRKLELQMDVLRTHPETVLCFSDVLVVGQDGRTIRRQGCGAEGGRASELDNEPLGSILNRLYLDNCIPAVSVVARRSTLEAIGGFKQPNGLPLVDIPTWLELALEGPFSYIAQPLASWRWHPFQVTKSYHIEILQSVRALVLKHYADLPEHVAARVRLDETGIDRHHRAILHRAYARSGRFKLVQGRFREARADFLRALTFPRGGFLIRLAALVGYASALLHKDMEWAARRFGGADIS